MRAPTHKSSRLLIAATLLLLPQAALSKTQRNPQASIYDAEVLTAWFELALSLTQHTSGFSPPVASRAFGYLGVTAYESVVPGIPAHRSLAGQLNDLPRLPGAVGRAYHWPTVANAALADMARHLYGATTGQAVSNLQAIDALEVYYQSRFAVPKQVHADSVERGRSVAAAIYAWSLTDGGHEGYLRNFPTTYTPPIGPGMWVPTPPSRLPALQPYWGSNRPFVLASSDACAPEPPLPYSEDPAAGFYAEAFEVYDTVNHLSPSQRETALYWSDDPGTVTPPGHSISIATQVLRQQRENLSAAAEVYARVGIALADVFIACWNTKYRYNVVRPVTYIQQVIDPSWGAAMALVTPPFPEYVSGHSAQSAATAQLLTARYGDLPFMDATNVDRGFAPRAFPSFVAAAEEAAISRLYGGIHYRRAIEEGLAQGRCVGETVERLQLSRAPEAPGR